MSDPMTLPVIHDLDAYRGDSWAQTFRFKRDTTYEDLTSATVTGALKGSDGVTHPLTVTKTDATNGEVTVQLPSEELPYPFYDYDIQVAMSGETQTWVRGRLAFTDDVT